jgi:hypothetical protein
MFNYEDYFEEAVDEIFNDPKHIDFVEDTLIDQLAGYNLVTICNDKDLRDDIFDTIIKRTKEIIGDHYKSDIDAEYEESEREYRADLAYDMYKEGC